MSNSTNIKVAVRIRPLLNEEKIKGLQMSKIEANLENSSIQIFNEKQNNYKAYRFDKVFDDNTTQQSLYEQSQIQYLIQQVVQGFHATVFAYGQTGSGKTYSMEGYKYEQQLKNPQIILPKIPKDQILQPSENEGLIPRAIRRLFQEVQEKREQTKSKISITCQYIQLYNEKIYDLLNSNIYKIQNKKLDGVPGLKLKWNQNDEAIIENVFCFECNTVGDALKYFWKGLKNKVMASHKINNSSSRSHCLLTFTIHQIDISNPDNIIVSKLQLVDLAGSERQSHAQSNRDPQLLKESIEINKSLFTLRQVISALTEKNNNNNQYTYIPYRESKLTSILRQSLGGNSYCLMLACLSPLDDFTEENISTLNYASRASHISNIPTINQDPKLKLINEQRKKIDRLQQELKRANDQIKFLTLSQNNDHQQKSPQSSTVVNPPSFCEVKESQTSGTVTINNNYNSNVIAIINNDQQQKQIELQENIQAQQATEENSGLFPELRSNSRICNQNQEFQDQMQSKQKQMNNDFQQFVQSKSDALKNLSTQMVPITNSVNQIPNQTITDRLILSISMIKEVLQSNLQLREDLLKQSQEYEQTQLQNFQLQIENEDLRDKLQLITNNSSLMIEYQAYLPIINIESIINSIQDKNGLIQAKNEILSILFSLRKENRNLQKRLEGTDKNKKSTKMGNHEEQNKSSFAINCNQQIPDEYQEQYEEKHAALKSSNSSQRPMRNLVSMRASREQQRKTAMANQKQRSLCKRSYMNNSNYEDQEYMNNNEAYGSNYHINADISPSSQQINQSIEFGVNPKGQSQQPSFRQTKYKNLKISSESKKRQHSGYQDNEFSQQISGKYIDGMVVPLERNYPLTKESYINVINEDKSMIQQQQFISPETPKKKKFKKNGLKSSFSPNYPTTITTSAGKAFLNQNFAIIPQYKLLENYHKKHIQGNKKRF